MKKSEHLRESVFQDNASAGSSNLNKHFLEKAMAAREQAHEKQEWYSTAEVLRELDDILRLATPR